MIYKNLLVIPKSGRIDLDYGCGGIRPNVTLKDAEYGTLYTNLKLTCQLFSTCRTIYAEAAPLYYGLKQFRPIDLDLLDEWLRPMRPDFRRLIGRIEVHYAGKRPAQAMRSLAEYISLKELTLFLGYHTLETMCPRRMDWELLGLNDLLKLWGLEKVTIGISLLQPELEYFLPLNYDHDSLSQALEVLKQPRKPAALTKQEKKDYPTGRSQRTVFGKANVITRTEKKFIAQQSIHM